MPVITTTNLTCIACNTANRIPSERLGDKPKCGRCKQLLFQGKAIELNNANVDSVLANTGIPLLVDCWAPWCGPCKAIAPILEELAAELDGKLKIVKVNIDENDGIAVEYGVRAIPTMILFKNGAPAATKVGAAPKSALKGWIESEI